LFLLSSRSTVWAFFRKSNDFSSPGTSGGPVQLSPEEAFSPRHGTLSFGDIKAFLSRVHLEVIPPPFKHRGSVSENVSRSLFS